MAIEIWFALVSQWKATFRREKRENGKREERKQEERKREERKREERKREKRREKIDQQFVAFSVFSLLFSLFYIKINIVCLHNILFFK